MFQVQTFVSLDKFAQRMSVCERFTIFRRHPGQLYRPVKWLFLYSTETRAKRVARTCMRRSIGIRFALQEARYVIQWHSEAFWVAGPEVKPSDFILQFQAMRDEEDENNTTLVCRSADRKCSYRRSNHASIRAPAYI